MSGISFVRFGWQYNPWLQNQAQEFQENFTRAIAEDNPSSEDVSKAAFTLQVQFNVMPKCVSEGDTESFGPHHRLQHRQLKKVLSMREERQAQGPSRPNVAVPPTAETIPLEWNDEIPLFLSFQELGKTLSISKAWNRSCQSLAPYFNRQCLYGMDRWAQQIEREALLSALPIRWMAFEMQQPHTLQEHHRELETLSRRFLFTAIQTQPGLVEKVTTPTQAFARSATCPPDLRDRLNRCVNVLSRIENHRMDILMQFSREVDVLEITQQDREHMLLGLKRSTIDRHLRMFSRVPVEPNDLLPHNMMDELEGRYNRGLQLLMDASSPAEAFAIASTCSADPRSRMLDCATRLADIDPEAAWDVVTNNESFLVFADAEPELTLLHLDPAQARTIAEKIPNPEARRHALMMCADLDDGKEDI
jgi:hypothetical protein